nr:uncharacterized protein LOC129267199 [Lytechinus pictus]
MKVHLFGATSSPGCANYGFKKAADDGEAEFGSDAASYIRDDFYVDDGLQPQWEKWRSEISKLEKLNVPRCYKPLNFGKVKCTELHHLSDASFDGYGQCSYLRLVNEEDKVCCSLVTAKSRVTPLRQMTVPRRELTAATVSAKMSTFLRKELTVAKPQELFWTDSQVVLGYIRNEARRFHFFVANRVQQIHDETNPKRWFYVNTEDNPADEASRGTTAKELVESSRWLVGPKFLHEKGEFKIPTEQYKASCGKDDPEVCLLCLQ